VVTAIKDVIRHATGLPDPVLHVLIGLLVFGLTALVLRKSLASWWPIGVVIALQAINELADAIGDIVRYGDIDVRGTLFDTVLTLLIPGLIFLLMRAARRRRGGAPG
jgi:hypothetical protein